MMALGTPAGSAALSFVVNGAKRRLKPTHSSERGAAGEAVEAEVRDGLRDLRFLGSRAREVAREVGGGEEDQQSQNGNEGEDGLAVGGVMFDFHG